ncbi:SCO family protein [Leptospira langatensis]|uniref:SCO family protein n=1 Tax=Leptospira langatensis TaxID=2484983 RepID=A0A5F1ZRP5_9LEPT|nr:SCO family protein [Leptospira langatensis]TGJ98974.1 SCO family protein [Leptospira langatensis]TGL40458.1 SCO family protein [Leptospira langatensis]
MRVFIAIVSISSLFLFCKEEKISDEYPKEITDFASFRTDRLPFFLGKDMRPEWDRKNWSDARSLEEFSLRDQASSSFGSKDLDGKISVVSFFFTGCQGICPLLTSKLKIVQSATLDQNDVVILSFSVAPDADTPELLSLYAKKQNIHYKRWKLVTGDKGKIYTLARRSLNADAYSAQNAPAAERLSSKDFLHSENVYLLDEKRRIRGVYSGRMDASMQELVRDIGVLRKEILESKKDTEKGRTISINAMEYGNE